MPRFREGDAVLLRGVVDEYYGATLVRVLVDGADAAVAVEEGELTMVTAAFQINDRVTWNRDAENIGIVRATIGAGSSMMLWVERPNGTMETLEATYCERAGDVDPAELETPPAPVAIEAEWTVHDPVLGAVPVFGPNWFVDVKGKDGVTREMVSPALVDWSNVIAYRDAEIPF